MLCNTFLPNCYNEFVAYTHVHRYVMREIRHVTKLPKFPRVLYTYITNMDEGIPRSSEPGEYA